MGREQKAKKDALNVVSLGSWFACSPDNLFVDFFFEFAWGFGIEKWGVIFGEFSVVSVSQETQHEISSKTSRETSE